MTESILTSIKKLLGIEESYEHFDADIMIHINSALSTLFQVGVESANGFRVTSKEQTWNDLFDDKCLNLESIKTYIYLKVRLVFDPPASATVLDSMIRMSNELEWRINTSM